MSLTMLTYPDGVSHVDKSVRICPSRSKFETANAGCSRELRRAVEAALEHLAGQACRAQVVLFEP